MLKPIQYIKELRSMKLLLSLVFYFFIFSSSALNLDSLWNIWNDTTQTDSNRLKAMYGVIWNRYLFSQPDSAYYFAGLHLELAKDVGNRKWQASALNTIGATFYIRGSYKKALSYYLKSLKIYEEIGNINGMASSYNNIGILNAEQEYYEDALIYNEKSVKIYEETGDKEGLANTYNNIGVIYANQKKYDKTLIYYQKSLDLEIETGDKKGIAGIYINIGITNRNQGDYEQALSYCRKGVKIQEELGDDQGLAFAYKSIGAIYFDQENYAAALSFAKKALTFSQQVSSIRFEREAYELLYKVYKKTGRSAKALQMHELYIEFRDSIYNKENVKDLFKQKFKYEYEKKAAADSVRNAELARVKQSKILAQEAEYNRKKVLSIGQYIGLFMAIVFIIFVFNRLKDSKKRKRLIESQTDKIMESINYAKKIQDTLLPSVDDIRSSVGNLFVHYKPRRIVSGDFYWHKEFEGHTVIACVDCIDQKMMGGLMSTMGNLLLDKVVNRGSLNSSEILTNLSDEIIDLLHQEEGGAIQEGMGISVCMIDRKNQKIEYSGARNGIIVVSDGKAERHKADLFPVGGNYTKDGMPVERKFRSHEISIGENDWVYMFTDGFLEQLGGEKGKLMGYKRFEDHLIQLSGLENENAKHEFLSASFDKWRGSHEQNDDLLVMGFQLT